LLKQWKSEMATHAPSLRVCVYTGWKSLLDGVEKRTSAGIRERKDNAKRKRASDRARAQIKRKYRKDSEGGRVKVESDEEGEEVDDDDDDPSAESLQHRTQRMFVDFVRAHDVVITTYG
jgi:E3 ubiquitin-protein ligase SHPRH